MRAVSSSMPTPSTRGFCVTAPISRAMRPRTAKCWSMSISWASPSPGAISSADLMRYDASPLFETSIVSLIADAPADVPAITPPCSKISWTREYTGVSPTWLVILSWSPPVKNTPVAPSRMRIARVVVASSRDAMSRRITCDTPSARTAVSYCSHNASGSALATVHTTILPPSTSRSATTRRIFRSPVRSSCPPMMTSVPLRDALERPGRRGRSRNSSTLRFASMIRLGLRVHVLSWTTVTNDVPLRRDPPHGLWLVRGASPILIGAVGSHLIQLHGPARPAAALAVRARGRRLPDLPRPLRPVRDVLGAGVFALAAGAARLLQRPVAAREHFADGERRLRPRHRARVRADERGADRVRLPGVPGRAGGRGRRGAPRTPAHASRALGGDRAVHDDVLRTLPVPHRRVVCRRALLCRDVRYRAGGQGAWQRLLAVVRAVAQAKAARDLHHRPRHGDLLGPRLRRATGRGDVRQPHRAGADRRRSHDHGLSGRRHHRGPAVLRHAHQERGTRHRAAGRGARQRSPAAAGCALTCWRR